MHGTAGYRTEWTWFNLRSINFIDPRYLPAEYRVDCGLHPAALRGLLRELVAFELTEFEAPSNPERRARAVQTTIRMIEPVFMAGPDRGTRVYEPCACRRPCR
jgi:hypothetical protein